MTRILLIIALLFTNLVWAVDEITPYKYTDEETANGMPNYDIPTSSRFTVQRNGLNAPDIIYYFSRPHIENYPIAILCGGSSSPENITSIIHFHRYFLQELIDLGAGVITVEQWGIDGQAVNKEEFMSHYTRSMRLHDHQTVINHLLRNPPQGWNGQLIFLGVSEGGPIVTSLTTIYGQRTLATINWSGAGDWSWREQLWVFLQSLLDENGGCPDGISQRDCEDSLSRQRYDARMDLVLLEPQSDKFFLNMTNKYHADALLYPGPDYEHIRSPFLVVSGALDTLIDSSDAFVRKVEAAGANVRYFRVSDMDHFVRKRPDIILQSFDWLREQMRFSNASIFH